MEVAISIFDRSNVQNQKESRSGESDEEIIWLHCTNDEDIEAALGVEVTGFWDDYANSKPRASQRRLVSGPGFGRPTAMCG
jgi:hypothetical protein